jgi:hypothetical protein
VKSRDAMSDLVYILYYKRLIAAGTEYLNTKQTLHQRSCIHKRTLTTTTKTKQTNKQTKQKTNIQTNK